MSASKAGEFSESVIRKMTRLAMEHNAVNLSQGFPNEAPDFQAALGAASAILGGTEEHAAEIENTPIDPAHLVSVLGLKSAGELKGVTLKDLLGALRKTEDQLNQYSIPFGRPALRQAIADYYMRFYKATVDPETQVTVCLGATEGIAVAIRAIGQPGDVAIVIQPFHEMYVNQLSVFGLKPRFVTLRETETDIKEGGKEWMLDRGEVERAFEEGGVRILLLCSPHNPTGKVFNQEELKWLTDLCIKRNTHIITDEIYEHIIYTHCTNIHTCLLNWQHVRERIILVNSMSKTCSATGWRVGWIIAREDLTQKIRAVHDTIAMQAPTPMQVGITRLLRADEKTFRAVRDHYQSKLDILLPGLTAAGFSATRPEGAYYLFANYRGVKKLAHMTPTEAAVYMTKGVGVACVPGDNFYGPGAPEGQQYIRFAFCRSETHLKEACARMLKAFGGEQ
eukprot:GDKI01028373.1.p1 GENE.GDKI01028373.1~~GDKI01028373.1.p1  ORF type:complete len:465 (-),score=124.27 GDKI01028373.1:233-1585(-)